MLGARNLSCLICVPSVEEEEAVGVCPPPSLVWGWGAGGGAACLPGGRSYSAQSFPMGSNPSFTSKLAPFSRGVSKGLKWPEELGTQVKLRPRWHRPDPKSRPVWVPPRPFI